MSDARERRVREAREREREARERGEREREARERGERQTTGSEPFDLEAGFRAHTPTATS